MVMAEKPQQSHGAPNAEKAGVAKKALVTAKCENPGPTHLFAVVDRNGTLRRGLYAVSSQKADIPNGGYEVIFNRDITHAAYIATIGSPEFSGIEQTGEITVVGRVGNPHGVFLTTTDSSGNFADRGFHLVVISYEGFAS
jgi:hypothetical protein